MKNHTSFVYYETFEKLIKDEYMGIILHSTVDCQLTPHFEIGIKFGSKTYKMINFLSFLYNLPFTDDNVHRT